MKFARTLPPNYVNRKRFDHRLIESAIYSGCVFRDRMKVVGFDPIQKSVAFANGDREKFQVLVGADGALSLIARSLFGKFRSYKQNTAIGISAKIPKEKVELGSQGEEYIKRPNIYFDVVRWGYGWVFPNKEYVNVGLAGLISENPHFGLLFRKFIESLPIRSIDNVCLRAHPIPYGKRRISLGKANIILIGDAAGFVEPVTGEGIYYAIKSAQLAEGWS